MTDRNHAEVWGADYVFIETISSDITDETLLYSAQAAFFSAGSSTFPAWIFFAEGSF